VVASAVGGVPDVIASEHACLVPPEDPAVLARALALLRADPDQAAHRAEAARAHLALRFGLEPWLDAWERIYRSIQRPTR
jgi:glycosyltransferase involved in cell wall biosynthesis